MSATLSATSSRPRRLALVAVVGTLLVYHAAIGILSLFFPSVTVEFAGAFYGTQLHLDSQAEYMLKALGMYALFVAGVLAVAARDLQRYRPILLLVAGLQLLRAFSRLAFYDVLAAGLEVPVARNIVNVSLLVAEAAVLVLCSRAR